MSEKRKYERPAVVALEVEERDMLTLSDGTTEQGFGAKGTYVVDRWEE